MAILFVGLAVAIFLSIFYYRNKSSLNSRRVIERKKELGPLISEFVFFSENATKEEKKSYLNQKIFIRELLKDDFNRKVLASTLIDLKRDVSGETQNQLIDLYKNLRLNEDAYKKLKSWRWEVVAQGILELSLMQVVESYSLILGFLNDKRSIIRKQAELATVTLKNEGISYFLDTTNHSISEWQQVHIMDILKNTKDFDPPQFSAWLTSKNKHVVLFAIRLIKNYNQNDANRMLIELVKHKNKEVQEEAIESLRKFNVTEAIDTLKLVFWRASKNVKIAILGAIAEMGTENDIEFLSKIQNKRMNYLVKSKALSVINSIRPESILPTDGIVDTALVIIPEDEPQIETEHNQEEVKLEQAPLEVVEEVETPLVVEEVEIPLEDVEEEIPIVGEEVETPLEDVEEVETPILVEEVEIPIEVIKEMEAPTIDQYEVSKSGLEPINEDSDKEVSELSFTLDFLPKVVVEEVLSEINNATPELEDIHVNFEEIKPENRKTNKEIIETMKPDSMEISEEELSFLPYVVVKEAKASEANTEDAVGYSLKDLLNLLGYTLEDDAAQVEHEKIKTEKIKALEEDAKLEEELLSLDSEQEEKAEAIIDFEVEFEETEIASNDSIDWSNLSKDPRKENTSKNNSETPRDEKKTDFSIIPKSYSINEETAERIHLLSDIEELGDKREIPFLTALLSNEKSPLIIEKIEDIIYKFSTVETPGIEEATQTENSKEGLRYSVFEELFVRCDTDSKLILMKEMLEIGDEKEVGFLKKLVNDKEEIISEKAELTLSKLQEKLKIIPQEESIGVEINVSNSSTSDFINHDEEDLLVFADEFRREQNVKSTSDQCALRSQNTLETMIIEPIKAIHAKIINKLNG